MSKILLVRLSSMGDVIHNLPAVTDLACHYPNAEIHWVVEEGFTELPAMHPAVRKVLPFALRRWRKRLFDQNNRAEMQRFYERLRAERYDLVIDSQGLLKSAVVARLSGAGVAGYDKHSIREPLASWFYHRRYAIGRDQHAITRNRLLTGAALGYTPDAPVNYGIRPAALQLDWLTANPYVVLLTASSRDDKLWPELNWVALIRRLEMQGLQVVLPWGSVSEQGRARRIATDLDNAMVAPRLNLSEAACLLAGAQCVVGVDTGLVHLAAALATPTVALFCASDPGLTGVLASSHAVNLGRNGAPPTLDEVSAASEVALSQR